MIHNTKYLKLPPKRFRSGRTWVAKEQIEYMADSIVQYTKTRKHENTKTIAYVRGAYLEAVSRANKVLSSKYKVSSMQNFPSENFGLIHDTRYLIQEILTDDELAQLKKKGILWMKVGLRMEEAFEIFKKRIKDVIIKEIENNKQLRFYF